MKKLLRRFLENKNVKRVTSWGILYVLAFGFFGFLGLLSDLEHVWYTLQAGVQPTIDTIGKYTNPSKPFHTLVIYVTWYAIILCWALFYRLLFRVVRKNEEM